MRFLSYLLYHTSLVYGIILLKIYKSTDKKIMDTERDIAVTDVLPRIIELAEVLGRIINLREHSTQAVLHQHSEILIVDLLTAQKDEPEFGPIHRTGGLIVYRYGKLVILSSVFCSIDINTAIEIESEELYGFQLILTFMIALESSRTEDLHIIYSSSQLSNTEFTAVFRYKLSYLLGIFLHD